MSSLSPENILIVKNRAMGDSVMGLSTVTYIKSLYPDAKVYYAIPAWIVPLYKNVKTDVDEFIPLDLKNLFGWWKLRKVFFEKRIDLIYEMHLSGRTEKFFNLYNKVYKVPYHFHNHHKKEGGPVHDQGVIKPLIQRDLDGAWSQLGKESELPSFKDLVPKMEVKTEKKNQVVVGVVATRETKKWPLAYYRELFQKMAARNSETKILIPLSNSETDKKIETDLKSLGLPEQVEFLRASLDELPVKLAGSLFYIGNDTGLKHICIALGVKTFTFFGPEPPLEWHPYDEVNHPYFYIPNLECRTRTHHYCGLSQCDSMICLNQIEVNDVFEKVSPLLGQ